MKHHSYLKEVGERKYINPRNMHQLYHVLARGSDETGPRYSLHANPILGVDLAITNLARGGTLLDYDTLEKLTVQLLPPITDIPTEDNRLPEYDVGTTAREAVDRELFGTYKTT